MSTEELDKLKSILSHAHGRYEAKKRKWRGKRLPDETTEGTVALETSMIALPPIPGRFELHQMTRSESKAFNSIILISFLSILYMLND
jgi:hypothetical protein